MRKVTYEEYRQAMKQRARDSLHREALMILVYAYRYGVKIDESKIYEAVVRHR